MVILANPATVNEVIGLLDRSQSISEISGVKSIDVILLDCAFSVTKDTHDDSPDMDGPIRQLKHCKLFSETHPVTSNDVMALYPHLTSNTDASPDRSRDVMALYRQSTLNSEEHVPIPTIVPEIPESWHDRVDSAVHPVTVRVASAAFDEQFRFVSAVQLLTSSVVSAFVFTSSVARAGRFTSPVRLVINPVAPNTSDDTVAISAVAKNVGRSPV